MRVILVGYPGSQHIVPATIYLNNKYMPGFDFEYLNYKGHTDDWGKFLAQYIDGLDDDYVIFGLDDYLLNEPIKKESYDKAIVQLEADKSIVALKMFLCSESEHEEYPVTTQYTIWKRKYLVKLLQQIADPWDFELRGSVIFKEQGMQSVRFLPPIIEYNTSSSLSKRWNGIKWNGVSKEDREYITNNLGL